MSRQNLQRSGLLGSSRMTIQLFGLVFFATITMAAFGSQSVREIDGTGIRGGTQAPETRYDCRNQCTKPEGPGCVRFESEDQEVCDERSAGLVCGYRISVQKTVLECYEREGGPYPEPCLNDAPPKSCYKAKNCVCERVQYPDGVWGYICRVGNGAANNDVVYVPSSATCVEPS